MVERVTSHLKVSGRVTMGEVRDMFETSRIYTLALLDHLDIKKITRRLGEDQVIR